MPDITKENKKYFATVLQSVADLHKIETEIENDKGLFLKFTDFLTKNADEISKFHAVESEIADYLQKFSFAGNADFTPVKNKLLPLTAIRQKLVEMGEEAKKLSRKPDKYNCYKAMEVCKQLTLFCSKEMKSTDYDKVTTALKKNISALLKIQQEFTTENRILADIKEVIKKNTVVLNKYTFYNIELQQFVANFPNNRDSDLKTVEQRLAVLNDINSQAEEIEKLTAQLHSYADRFNKSSVLLQAESMLSSVYAQMKIDNTSSAKSNLKSNISILKSTIAAFNKEQKDTVTLRDRQKKQLSDIWQEDNEQIVYELDTIIKKGTEKQSFSLQSFQNRIQSAAAKKTQDINNALSQFHRLRKKSRQTFVNNWRTQYITCSQFQKEMNVRKRFYGHIKIII